MIYKTLSVKQPYATYICAGVKTVENRTWKTDYRGRLLIHASGDAIDWVVWDCIPKSLLDFVDEYDENLPSDAMCDPLPEDAPDIFKNYVYMLERLWKFYGVEPEDICGIELDRAWLKSKAKEYGYAFPAQAIIGEVNLVDIVQDSTDYFAEPGNYHWILSDPVWYNKPIIQVLGHLRLWNYEGELS